MMKGPAVHTRARPFSPSPPGGPVTLSGAPCAVQWGLVAHVCEARSVCAGCSSPRSALPRHA